MSYVTLAAASRVVDALESLRSGAPDVEGLRAWPGWGALHDALDGDASGGWGVLGDRLGVFLGGDVSGRAEVTARESLSGSFCTPAWLVELMWGVRGVLGAPSRVLEPSCGGGVFLGGAPEGVSGVGVDMDVTSCEIAGVVAPGFDVRCGDFMKQKFIGGFDTVMGNPPFLSSWKLHKFVCRALSLLSPGGVGVLVLPGSFEFGGVDGVEAVGRVRLPSTMWQGADVVADVVVFVRTGGSGVGVGAAADRFFHDFPGCVGGVPESGWRPKVIGDAGDVQAAFEVLRRDVLSRVTLPSVDGGFVVGDGGFSVGELEGAHRVVPGGGVEIVRKGEWVPVKASAELVALVALRDGAEALVGLERDGSDDGVVEAARAELLGLWRGYVDRFGGLRRGSMVEAGVDKETGVMRMKWQGPRMGGFRRDPGLGLVLSLEGAAGGVPVPAGLLVGRTWVPGVPVESCESVGEAVSVCVSERGGVEPERVLELVGRDGCDPWEVLPPAAFCDPLSGKWVPAWRYLSGRVAEKLTAVERMARVDSRYAVNVEALRGVELPWVDECDVDVQPGAPWVPGEAYQRFCTSFLGARGGSVGYEGAGKWKVDLYGADPSAKDRYSTVDVDLDRMVRHMLEGGTPLVFVDVRVGGQVVRRKCAERTAAAAAKLGALSDAFTEWMWTQSDLVSEMAERFNSTMRGVVLPTYPEGGLGLKGVADGVELKAWQVQAVHQATTEPVALIPHPVGAGKTWEIIVSIMELRARGVVQRPLVTVPDHLLDDFAAEVRRVYPAARVLAAGKDQVGSAGRRFFAGAVVGASWDIVIMTHTAFSGLPLSQGAADHVASILTSQVLAGEAAETATSKSVSRAVARANKLVRGSSADDGEKYTFDRLFDYVAVDEAHVFKRLAVNTAVDGFSLGSSKRAADLLAKLEWLRSQYPDRPYAALYSGTPVTNTLAELYVWQRYVQPEFLRSAGLFEFDCWAAAHVRYASTLEVSPDGGGFRLRNRPVGVLNADSLMLNLSERSHFLLQSELDLERPDTVRETVVIEATAEQQELVEDLVERAAAISRGGVRPEDDNMLAIVGDGRSSALDPELLEMGGGSPKLDAVAARVAGMYHDTLGFEVPGSDVRGALQLVFCDLGTPNADKGAQTYGRLVQRIIAAGVPADRVRVVHDAKTTKERAALFAACRAGEVSVLLGSTSKLGLGTNVQTRLVALHHVDAPWRASDVEQREGRAVRQGNYADKVSIYRYVTAGTFDAYQWQLIERKSKILPSLLAGSKNVDDLSTASLDYAAVKAAATGNPLAMRHAECAARARSLKKLRAMDRANSMAMLASAKTEYSAIRKLGRFDSVLRSVAAYVAENGPLDDWFERRGCMSLRWDTLGSEDRLVLIGADRFEDAMLVPWGRRRAKERESLGQGFVEMLNDVDETRARADDFTARREKAAKDVESLQAVVDGWSWVREPELAEALSALRDVEAEMRAVADGDAA